MTNDNIHSILLLVDLWLSKYLMMFLLRKYKKLMIFLIYVHNFKTIYIKKWREYNVLQNIRIIAVFKYIYFKIRIHIF